MIKLFRLNTGSCGACDQIIDLSIHGDRMLVWAETLQDADVLLITGPITSTIRPLFLEMLKQAGDKPLLAVGQCAMDGRPYAQAGVKALPELETHPRLSYVEGCPVTPERVAEAVRHALAGSARRRPQ